MSTFSKPPEPTLPRNCRRHYSICNDILESEQTCIVFGLGWWVMWLIFFLSFFVFALFLRLAIRRKYGIREECCT